MSEIRVVSSGDRKGTTGGAGAARLADSAVWSVALVKSVLVQVGGAICEVLGEELGARSWGIGLVSRVCAI